jgi:hypothetical protein
MLGTATPLPSFISKRSFWDGGLMLLNAAPKLWHFTF